MRQERGNRRVDGLSGGDHHQDTARQFQGGEERVETLTGDEVLVRRIRPKSADFVQVQIVSRYFESVAFHIQGEHVTHDAQTHYAEIGFVHLVFLSN